MSRKYNFYAGPATLPLSVLEQLKSQLVEYKDTGMSLIETSHRSNEYNEIHYEAINLVRELLGLSDDWKVLFLGGGATLQFSMIPMNFLTEGKSCDFTISGAWAKKAYADTKKIGRVNVIFDGSDSKFTKLPDASSLRTHSDAAYLHLTSNETIQGLEWFDWPETGDVPIIADMSSDMLSRPIPVDRFGVIYAGAQKNLGPAGVTMVLIRRDMLNHTSSNLTAYLDYNVHAPKDALYNTPPVFSIWALKLVLKWIKELGGLKAMEERAIKKSSILYSAIDESNGFYNSPVQKKNRSRMNVVFTLPNDELTKSFISTTMEQGMIGLKGHRSIGGCRASIYNAMPEEGVKKLADIMKEFARKNG